MVASKLANQYENSSLNLHAKVFMSSVDSTESRYSKEQKQQRSSVSTEQRAKISILSVAMRTTTNHFWSPRDLVTLWHAR